MPKLVDCGAPIVDCGIVLQTKIKGTTSVSCFLQAASINCSMQIIFLINRARPILAFPGTDMQSCNTIGSYRERKCI